jgi:Aerotolerance regulator N-terminal/von Willebrand factor type A domain
MTFLNPWMLLGGLALTIPVALHFFYRARYRPQPWAAMKFLRLSIEQTSRRLRFQEIILLALRILICIILALALARPAAKSLSGSGRGDSVDAIVVIDTSYSMGIMEGEGDKRRSRLDRAKEAALKVIDHLPPRSTIRVIACSDTAEPLGPSLTTDLLGAKKIIEELTPSSKATDFQSGLVKAIELFDNTTGNNREIYVFSDMQRIGWERQSAGLRSSANQIREKANLYLIRVSEEKTKVRNAAIIGIVPQDEVPHAGARVGFTVLVQNSGNEAITNLSLSLRVDGQFIEKDPRAIDRIGPHEIYPVTVTGVIDRPGYKLLTAQLGPDKKKDDPTAESSVNEKERSADDLEEDNVYNRIIYVHERVRILLIDGAPDSDNPDQAASFFLGNALLPVSDEMKKSYHIALSIVSADRAGPGELSEHDICVLANVGAKALPGEFVGALGDFVRSGRGLLIAPGDRVVPSEYNETFAGLLPLPLIEGPLHFAPNDKPLSPDLDSIDVQSFLAKFKEGGGSPLQTLSIAYTLKLLPVVDPRTAENKDGLGRVLLRFNDGSPLLASKQVGNGEVLMLTTSTDRQWNILYLVPAFAPFVNGCVAHLIERSTNANNQRAGQPLQWVVPDRNKKYYLAKPDGNRVYLGEPKSVGNGPPQITAYETSKAGVYRILAENQSEAEGTRFVLNPDLRESESLDALADDQIDAQLGYKPVHLSTGFDGSEFTGSERSRREWTIWVLVALLLFGFGELIWAWVCGRSW